MDNNDILRRFRYALDIKDSEMMDIFKEDDTELTRDAIKSLLVKDEEEGFNRCTDQILCSFLDGLIFHKRGKGEKRETEFPLSNNIIFKKARIALELKGDDIISIFELAGHEVSNSELTAIFRKKGQRNYKECQDSYLRRFLKGLAIYYKV